MPDARDMLAASLGIVASYTDQTGRRRRTSRATQAALMRALGVDIDSEAQATDVLRARRAEDAARCLPRYAIGTPGAAPDIAIADDAPWTLHREDGLITEGKGPLPALPLGLHRLRRGHETCTVITAPERLNLPPKLWGLTAPLYGLREPGRGLADYDDLAIAGAALAQHGGDFLGLNPIHAGFWSAPGSYSPYTPSHRRRLNAIHIPTPGHGPMSRDPVIDYARAIPAKRAMLEAAFAANGVDPDFDAFLTREGPALTRFATHQALSDLHGPYWTDWPADLQDPESPGTRQAARSLSRDIRFHAWLQYRAAEALAAAQSATRQAGATLGLYLDLAVGTHPAGAETWEDPNSFARGVSLGAPPDAFAAEGQRWGLAPFNPHALVEAGFLPLAETLRTLFTHAGAVRIDHILGFDRAFWVPDIPGIPGAYIQMPRDAMLAIVRLEAARVGGVVVGEDLGNVPRGLRKGLAVSGILGCRVAIFEQVGAPPRFRDPKRYPAASLASFSTHDLPTWQGWRKGHEITLRAGLGHISDNVAKDMQDHRKAEVAAFDAMTTPHREDAAPGAQAALTHALAASGSTMVAVQAETVFEVTAQPNLPGTTVEYPNWRHPLPISAQDWHGDANLTRTAQIMTTHGRGRRT